jgi:gas vesicle protein
MKDRSTGLTFIAGIVVGAAVGALAGLLFAPDSGAETRKKISAKGKEIADEMHKKFDGLKETVSETLDELKKVANKKA